MRQEVSREQESWLSVEHLKPDLKGRTVRGGVVTIAAQGVKFLLTLGRAMIFARLLTPDSFGLVAMVTAVTGFVAIFMDAGLSFATVQRESIEHQQISSLFWINVAIGGGLMVITAALAPLLAWFYSEPRLVGITLVVATTFLISGCAVQHEALLSRQMRFRLLATIQVSSMTAGVTAGIVAAGVCNLGYWSLVVVTVTEITVRAILVFLLCNWRPAPPHRTPGVGSLIKFGGNLTLFNAINYFARNADNIMIGRIWGATSLGLYSKAYSLLLLPIQQINWPISRVAIPVLSRLKDDPPAYRRYYRRAVGLIVLVGMPIVMFLAVEARNLIYLLLGEKWLDSVIIFRALAPAAFLGTFNVATGWVYISIGHVERQVKWAVINTLVIVTAFVVAVRYGALGVAITFSVCQLVLVPVSVLFCFVGTPLGMRDLIAALWRSAVAALVGGVSVWIFQVMRWTFPSAVLQVAASGASFCVVYAAVWFTLPGGKKALRELVELLRHLRAKTKSER